jgi:hypothetical protein
VGLAGIEPYIEALDHGAEVIIAGRSSDTSIFAALPVMRGCNPATAWHMAKILECGAACVEQRKYPDCMVATLADDHFVLEPPNPEYRCDPVSVASHNLYENSTPYELIEPSGVLSTVDARYEALSDRAVRVSGSTFRKSERYHQAGRRRACWLPEHHRRRGARSRDPAAVRLVARRPGDACATASARSSGRISRRNTNSMSVFGKNAAMGPLEPETAIGLSSACSSRSPRRRRARHRAHEISWAHGGALPCRNGRSHVSHARTRWRTPRRLPFQPEPRGGARLAARDVQDRIRERPMKLWEVAKLIRSKNSGPFELTFDVIMKDRATYEKVRDAKVINAQWFARTYRLRPEVVSIINYDAAAAIKITIPRPTVSGDIDDNDVFGGQQYGPLVDLEIP